MQTRRSHAHPQGAGGEDGAMRWLLRLLFIKLLGKRALPILAILGLIQAWRGGRTRDVEALDPRTGRVRTRQDSW